MTILEAHRGVSTECPENTYAAFRMAAALGYSMIELDPNYTRDGQLVVLHDKTINRTARTVDGEQLAEPMNIREVTYEEACNYDYGIYFSNKYQGEQLPLLTKVFEFAKEKGIAIKIDNTYEQFPAEIQEKLFAMIRSSGAEIGLTCRKVDSIRQAVTQIPDVAIHYDGPVEEDILKELTSITRKLTVWLPYQCQRTSWVNVPFASKELCGLVKRYASLGIWLIDNEVDYRAVCQRFDPDVVETDGGVKPKRSPFCKVN